MSSQLHLDVFVVPYKPIVALIAPMGAGEATWPATSVSLISGDRDAVLIDALITAEDAGRLVGWIRATGKNLTTIYITHGHGDGPRLGASCPGRRALAAERSGSGARRRRRHGEPARRARFASSIRNRRSAQFVHPRASAIENDGTVLEALDQPRASFAGLAP